MHKEVWKILWVEAPLYIKISAIIAGICVLGLFARHVITGDWR